MWRRFARTSRITCDSSTRSCARRDISSSTGAAVVAEWPARAASRRFSIASTWLAEFRRQVVEVLERAFREQQRGRELHRQRLRDAFGRHVGKPLDEAARQLRQRRMPDFRRLRIGRGEQLRELRQSVGAPRRRLEPCILGARELVARVAQQRLQPHDVRIERFGGRDQRREVVGALHGLDLRRRRCAVATK